LLKFSIELSLFAELEIAKSSLLGFPNIGPIF